METPAFVLRILLTSCSLLFAARGHSLSIINVTHSRPPFSSAAERLLDNIEDHIISVAEAMPEDKFNFTPEDLSIKGSDFKGVRSFATQIKHLATINFALWSSLTGDVMPQGTDNVNGPENLKTKAEIIKFLKESFALGHKTISMLTEKKCNGYDILSRHTPAQA
jgi:hypothetical protein